MIVVVADTSPLNYLVQIDCQENEDTESVRGDMAAAAAHLKGANLICITQTRKREKQIHVRQMHQLADVHT